MLVAMSTQAERTERVRLHEGVAHEARAANTLVIEWLLANTNRSYTSLAEDFGLSKQRIGQIAKRAGIHRKRGARPIDKSREGE